MAISVRLERRGQLPVLQRVAVVALGVALGALAGGLLVQASGYSAL